MTVDRKLKVLVVDDHSVVRAGLRAVLADEPDFAIIDEAASAREAIIKAHALKPDVVLMDIRMGGDEDASGVEACREIRAEMPATQVIMFTSYGQRESVLASILAGATGFLPRTSVRLSWLKPFEPPAEASPCWMGASRGKCWIGSRS